MCECYKVGGPFISEDPDCSAHGRDARAREAEQEAEQEADALDAMRYRQLRALHDGLAPGWHVRGADGQPIHVGDLDEAIDASFPPVAMR